MNFIPYKANECLENTFYQIPKELFINPAYTKLSSDSKLLYGLLLDRLSISIKNNWVDKDGNIYLIFSRKEAQEKLNLSDKPVTKSFRQLNDAKLIHEIRQGFKKNNIIYVGKLNHIDNDKFMNRKKSDSGNGNNTNQESENVRSNKNKYNKNKSNNISETKKFFTNYEQRQYDNLDFLYANKIFEN